MNRAVEYLDILQEREPQLFKEKLQRSSLTDKDIMEIEQELGYTLPASYKEFLQSYQMPRKCKVYFSFCGDYAANFEDTFLDLVTGKIVYIYHEEIYELEIVYEVDTSSKEEIRDFLLVEEFCHDFNDFLRLVCTGDIFDDNTLTFV